MIEYTFKEETAKNVIKKQAISRIPMFVIAFIAGLYISNLRSDGDAFSNKWVLIISIIGIFVAGALGWLMGIKNGTKALLKNKFILTDNYIERFTPSGKIVRIEFAENVKHQVLKSGLLIKSSSDKILIPAVLDEFDELSSLVMEKIK
ncbi:MAG: hypothetical protein PHI36_04455 [Bacteroidales bacterium]|nr:hypothetical protein [Bacteroidales bacterium]